METTRRELIAIGREMVSYGHGRPLPAKEAYRCDREHLLVAWLAMPFRDAERI